MKKFKYYGREVEVPDYATHIAVDTDGECWWYMVRPVKSGEWWCTWHGGNCGRVGYFENMDKWKGSLQSC